VATTRSANGKRLVNDFVKSNSEREGEQSGPQPGSQLAVLPILGIDDEPAIRSYIQAVLERSGYKVVCCESGIAALPLLRSREFLAVICDWRMPGGMDGDDIYTWISQHHPELVKRFIFQTGDIASEDTAGRLRTLGVPYIEKPFGIQEFLSLVEKTMGKAL
jgi:phosphoserine phosphatase RsbU/P